MESSRYFLLAERLFPKILKRDGLLASEVKAAEKRLRIRLPAPLVEMYRKVGKRADLHAAHDRLLAPNLLMLVRGALVFYQEHSQLLAWGIATEDLVLDDPPVKRAKNEPPFVWEDDHDTLSGFFVTELLWQHVHSEPCRTAKVDDAVLAKIAERFPPIDLEGCHWDVRGVWGSDGLVFWARGIAPPYDLHVGAASHEEMEAALAAFPALTP